MSLSSKADMQMRPVVYDYRSPSLFLKDLHGFYKQKHPSYSLRQRIKLSSTQCSLSLVSQIINKKRTLKRDQLPNLAKVFSLSDREFEHLDVLLRQDLSTIPFVQILKEEIPKKIAKNHILNHWLHPYVKDLAMLKGFVPNVTTVHSMLRGLAAPPLIERSLEFLFREGFLKKTANKQTVVDESVTFSTNEIPNEKIRNFDRKALKIADQGILNFGIEDRKCSTVLLSVNKKSKQELRAMIDDFQHQLSEFIVKNQDQAEELVQVVVHLTPIGAQYEK